MHLSVLILLSFHQKEQESRNTGIWGNKSSPI